MSYSDRRRAHRKDSGSSSRSQHRPKRKHSGDSTSGYRKHGRHSGDRHRSDRGRLGSIREEDTYGVDAKDDSPPSYDVSQVRDMVPQDGGENGGSTKPTKPMSAESRVAWGVVLVLPLLAATLLLFLITASSSDLRTDFAIVKISISQATFEALYSLVQNEPKSGPSALDQTKSLAGVRRAPSSGGYMTLGVWGWCIKTSDSSKTGCSTSSAWFTMEKTLGNASVGEIKADDFNSFLTHCLVTHGLALMAAMLAIVPVGVFVYRRYYKNSEQVEGGWFQHGTILAAFVLATFARVVDKFVLSSLGKKLSEDMVLTGPAVTLVGIAALLLGVSFMTSGVPVLGRFAKFKYNYAKRWNNLEHAAKSSPTAEEEKGTEERELERTRRKKPGRSRRKFKDTMTRMLYR